MKTPTLTNEIKTLDLIATAKRAAKKDENPTGANVQNEMSRYKDLFIMHGWAATFSNAAAATDGMRFIQPEGEDRTPINTYDGTHPHAALLARWGVSHPLSKEIVELIKFFGKFNVIRTIADRIFDLAKKSEDPTADLPKIVFKSISFQQPGEGDIMKFEIPHNFAFTFDIGETRHHYVLSEDWKTIRDTGTGKEFPAKELDKELDALVKEGAEEVIDPLDI